jgi:hypothetical protein
MYDEEDVGMHFLKLNAILDGTESLTDKYEIEPVLSAMHQMERKVEFLKELKRRRVSVIDEQIATEQANIDKLYTAIKACMKLNKDKSYDFPGVGKVSLRKTKGTWTIVDEEALRKHLEGLKKFEEVSEETWRFKKKELNKVLDELEKNNNVSAAAKREDEKESLSVTYPKESVDVVAPTPTAPSQPPAVSSTDNLVI